MPEASTTILRRRISKKVLAAVPVHERNFFLAAAHVVNEINFLHKLSIWSMRPNSDPQIVMAQACQTLMLLRLLVGKLNEAHELVRRAYNSTQLSREYDAELATEAKDAYRGLSKYFGKANLIYQIRNGVAFHYSAEAMDGALQQVSPDDDLEIFVAERLPNTLYVVSEALVTHTMLAPKGLAGFDQLMQEAIEISRLFLSFLDGCVGVFLSRYGSDLFEDDGSEKHEVKVSVKFEDMYIPWFTQVH